MRGSCSLVGLHAGAACLFNDTAFGVALGSWFDYHPDLQNVTFTKLVDHPTVAMLPSRYTYPEEAHHFRSDPRSVGATVLLSFDETLIEDPRVGTRPYYQGNPPPIAWYRERGSIDLTNGTGTGGAGAPRMTGRTWFSSLGHTTAFWEDDVNLQHVEAGLRWALEGVDDVSNSTTSSSSPTSSSATSGASASSAGAPSSSPTSSAAPSPSSSSTSSSPRMYSTSAPTLALCALATLCTLFLSRLA